MAIVASLMGGNRACGAPSRSAPPWVRGLRRDLVRCGLGRGPARSLGISPLDMQAATGLLAIAVLLVIMNWFFHRVYWTGWISPPQPHEGRLLPRPGAERRMFPRARPARLRERLPRGLRDRPLPAEPAALLRPAVVLEGVSIAARPRRDRRRRHVPEPPPAAVPADAGGDRGDARRRARRHGRRAGAGDAAGRLDPTTPLGVASRHWLGTWFARSRTSRALVAQARRRGRRARLVPGFERAAGAAPASRAGEDGRGGRAARRGAAAPPEPRVVVAG